MPEQVLNVYLAIAVPRYGPGIAFTDMQRRTIRRSRGACGPCAALSGTNNAELTAKAAELSSKRPKERVKHKIEDL